MKKKILMIFTGGTIAMKVDEDIGAALPGVESSELVNMVREVRNFTDIETIDYANIPSPHMTPSHMLDLAKLVKKNIGKQDITGIVISHGTDTMEETAYFLDLMINSDKPIVLVGSMRNNSQLAYDGAANIAGAIYTASSAEARGKGVLLVMNDEIHAARYVTKTNTVATDTFKSPEFGPLGIISNGRVLFYMESLKREHISTDKIETRVGLIKAAAGLEGEIIDYYIDNDYRGLVIEALGSGNLPLTMLEGVKRAVEKNIPIVLVSRCLNGCVEPVYGYEGGGNQLQKMGLIFGGNLSGQKARIKLMQILGATKDLSKIREMF